MATAKIAATIQAEKKQLVDLMLKKANVSADQVIDVALTQWIRLNLDLLSEADRKRFGKFLTKA
jgi:hypothetical protein